MAILAVFILDMLYTHNYLLTHDIINGQIFSMWIMQHLNHVLITLNHKNFPNNILLVYWHPFQLTFFFLLTSIPTYIFLLYLHHCQMYSCSFYNYYITISIHLISSCPIDNQYKLISLLESKRTNWITPSHLFILKLNNCLFIFYYIIFPYTESNIFFFYWGKNSLNSIVLLEG